MGSFFAELKRRHIYRVAAAYAVVAWVLLQIVNNVAPVLDLPVWVARAFLLLLVIGFPITLLISWTRELAAADAATPATTKLDYVIAGGLLVVIALISYQQLARPSGANSPQPAPVAARSGAFSIAVLPFANLSNDQEQQFFSDGITDEIMTTLAKLQSLRVVARESAFQFKGERNDMRAVGKALGAQYLINGSVRRAGERVRITAQLVDANSGVGLWSDSYDRELKDIFATQDEIAQSIASALRVPLGLAQGVRLVSSAADADSYQQYLRAKALVRSRNPRGAPALMEASVLLEQLVAHDPNYAPAWALLSEAYSLTPTFTPALLGEGFQEMRRVSDQLLPKAEAAAVRAIQLDPNSASAYSSLGRLRAQRGNHAEAEDLYKKALAFDPNNADVLLFYSNLLLSVGRLKEALAMKRQVQALEPFVPAFNSSLAAALWVTGDDAAAIGTERAMAADAPERSFILALMLSAAGRYGEAADAIMETPPAVLPAAARETAQVAARLLRTAPATTSLPGGLPTLQARLAWVYAFVGAPDRAVEAAERPFESGDISSLATATFWHPAFAAVRKTERFRTYMRNAGFVDYWKARGWPDLCRPVGADDFVCD